MYESTNPFIQSELDYRQDRIRSSVVKRKSRQSRFPRVRRPVPTDTVR
ncbi:MAG: hypothetical protein JWO76_3066 [Nocardioides sp.]|nr:hypothetical protein [Nocardioides sp.]